MLTTRASLPLPLPPKQMYILIHKFLSICGACTVLNFNAPCPLPFAPQADVHPDAPAGWCQEAQEEDLHQAQEAEAQVSRSPVKGWHACRMEGGWAQPRSGLCRWLWKCAPVCKWRRAGCGLPYLRAAGAVPWTTSFVVPAISFQYHSMHELHGTCAPQHRLAGREEIIASVNPLSGFARAEERSI